MGRTREPYPLEFRQRMIELAHNGKRPLPHVHPPATQKSSLFQGGCLLESVEVRGQGAPRAPEPLVLPLDPPNSSLTSAVIHCDDTFWVGCRDRAAQTALTGVPAAGGKSATGVPETWIPRGRGGSASRRRATPVADLDSGRGEARRGIESRHGRGATRRLFHFCPRDPTPCSHSPCAEKPFRPGRPDRTPE